MKKESTGDVCQPVLSGGEKRSKGERTLDAEAVRRANQKSWGPAQPRLFQLQALTIAYSQTFVHLFIPVPRERGVVAARWLGSASPTTTFAPAH